MVASPRLLILLSDARIKSLTTAKFEKFCDLTEENTVVPHTRQHLTACPRPFRAA